jgi:transcriptional regulator with XRE-family HTH domain
MSEAEKRKTAAKQKERERLNRAIVTMIRAARDDADMTQAELAAAIGLPYRAVVNMEHQRRIIEASDLIMIARALKLNPATLLERVLSWSA